VGKALGGLPEEAALSVGAGPPDDGVGTDSIGRYLERQRRLRGMSLQELSTLTRIPTRSLERLEAGAFDRDPDGFTRGFVRAVASAIGLDPQATVERMLSEVKPPRLGAPQNLLPGLVGLAALVMFALIAVAVASFLGEPSVPTATPAEPELRRRDFVRELAERRAVVAPPVTPAEPSD